jgi:UDP-glucose 4-epimerase
VAGLPRRVAVTGGAGFIGSHTVERLAIEGCRVLVIDDGSHPCGAPLPASVEGLEADCGSPTAAEALRAFRPDAVLHLASKGGVERARRDPGAHVRASLASTVALYHAAAEAGAARVVSASSGGALYGRPDRIPTGEETPPAPLSAYGAAKLSEEVYLAMLRRQRQIQGLSLRYGNVYGPRQDGTGEAGLVAITCVRLLSGQRPVIFGDGLRTRDFVYVADVVEANVAALASARSGAVNVGGGAEASVREVVDGLRELSGSRVEVEFAPARASEVPRVCLDRARAAEWLGWRPRVSLRVGLARTYASFSTAAAPQRGAFPSPLEGEGRGGGEQ